MNKLTKSGINIYVHNYMQIKYVIDFGVSKIADGLYGNQINSVYR